MINGKELTVEEVIKEMSKLKERYYYIAHLLHINFLSIRLKGVEIKDIMVNGGRRTSDKMLLSIAKSEDLKIELENTRESYYSYRDLLIDKIIDMKETKTTEEMILFYKDTMHYKFEDIAVLVGYGIAQTKRKYYSSKDDTK